MDQPKTCFVCEGGAKSGPRPGNSEITDFDCARCGIYGITYNATSSIKQIPDRYILSGVLREQSDLGKPLTLSMDNIERLIQSAIIPADPIESIEYLLQHIYKWTQSADRSVPFVPANDFPLVYAKNTGEFCFFIEQAKSLDFIEAIGAQYNLRLKLNGWKKIGELKNRYENKERIVFMAMQFGNEEHDKIYKDHFKLAVAQTGFELKRLDERPAAGLIDNQLRVQIRRARFLLADLTNENRGAYWEAGFAEGLGKPVIYLCKKSDFEKMKTHFDTEHHLTIKWDEKDLKKAEEELKATIRATFPAEAKMDDK